MYLSIFLFRKIAPVSSTTTRVCGGGALRDETKNGCEGDY